MGGGVVWWGEGWVLVLAAVEEAAAAMQVRTGCPCMFVVEGEGRRAGKEQDGTGWHP